MASDIRLFHAPKTVNTSSFVHSRVDWSLCSGYQQNQGTSAKIYEHLFRGALLT